MCVEGLNGKHYDSVLSCVQFIDVCECVCVCHSVTSVCESTLSRGSAALLHGCCCCCAEGSLGTGRYWSASSGSCSTQKEKAIIITQSYRSFGLGEGVVDSVLQFLAENFLTGL